MLKLIVGVKGTGKTKTLISMVNEAVEKTQGSVVCIEKGVKLRYDLKYQVRLINSNEYLIFDAQSLYGFIAGVMSANHDVTDLFVDSTLKICNQDMAAFEKLILELDELTETHKVNIVMTASLPVEEASDLIKKHM
ncbi:MAG: ATP-binding protein [Clostridia bacterium]|nr:ATP-binding protein [Clostridia bacterium]MEE1116259.1 ATP-binding protein [Clostridia bacterium]